MTKATCWSTLTAAICGLVACVCAANAADLCVPYGDERGDYTWRLCPAGEKYERQYLYFGFWSDFYKVGGNTGACTWSAIKTRWVCPDRTIRCDGRRCGKS